MLLTPVTLQGTLLPLLAPGTQPPCFQHHQCMDGSTHGCQWKRRGPEHISSHAPFCPTARLPPFLLPARAKAI